MTYSIKDFLQSTNLVIWGCGNTARYLVESRPNIINNITGCVDSNINMQGKVFLDNWTIKDPSIVNVLNCREQKKEQGLSVPQ